MSARIEAVIADVLRECGYLPPGHTGRRVSELILERFHADRMVVVELPEPDAPHSAIVGGKPWGGPIWQRVTAPGGGSIATVTVNDEVTAAISCIHTADDARWAAGALLAAAAEAP